LDAGVELGNVVSRALFARTGRKFRVDGLKKIKHGKNE
jgi:hypothetical protein